MNTGFSWDIRKGQFNYGVSMHYDKNYEFWVPTSFLYSFSHEKIPKKIIQVIFKEPKTFLSAQMNGPKDGISICWNMNSSIRASCMVGETWEGPYDEFK